ncbi:MAG: hypothetical protein QM778_31920 [Myxococcales bacterium]
MRHAAQTGRAWWFLGAALVWGCDNGSQGNRDAGSPGDGGAHSDASAQECEQNQDCWLIPVGCCGACEPDRSQVRAVPTTQRPLTCDVLCGACPEPVPDSIRPQLRAACVSGACAVVDLRQEESTRCSSANDCEARPTGCCAGCADDPSGWFAFHKGVEDSTAPECDPVPPCLQACPQGEPPAVDCADDHHCAVRN